MGVMLPKQIWHPYLPIQIIPTTLSSGQDYRSFRNNVRKNSELYSRCLKDFPEMRVVYNDTRNQILNVNSARRSLDSKKKVVF